MHLAYSSLASSTYQNAEIAIREFEDIYLIDTRNVSGGCTAHLAKTYEIVQAKKDTVTDYKALADEIESWNKKSSVLHSWKSGLSESRRTGLQCCIPGRYTAPSETTDRDRGRTTSCLQEIPRSIEKFVDTYMEEYLAKHDVSRKCLYLMYSKGFPRLPLTG